MPTFVIQYRIPAETQETTVDADDRERAIDQVVLANPDVEVEIIECKLKDEPAAAEEAAPAEETPAEEVAPEATA